MQKWYAVMAKPRKEQTAVSFLEQVGVLRPIIRKSMNTLASREDDVCVGSVSFPGTSLRGLTTTSSIGWYPIAEVCGKSLHSVKSQRKLSQICSMIYVGG